jgi:hypothetical protein
MKTIIIITILLINTYAKDIDASIYFGKEQVINRTISLSPKDRLIFDGNNTYYTNGNRLEIVAKEIVLNGTTIIKAFPDVSISTEYKQPAKSGRSGRNGQNHEYKRPSGMSYVLSNGKRGYSGDNGANGIDGKTPKLIIIKADVITGLGKLKIINDGQNGGQGQMGGQGGNGGNGGHGRDAKHSIIQHWCNTRGGHGGNGGIGGQGGNGGRGGSGGHIFYTKNLYKYIYNRKLILSTYGGLGGIGGHGGRGGLGGIAGLNGRVRFVNGCYFDGSSMNGRIGLQGEHGQRGKMGRNGRIIEIKN